MESKLFYPFVANKICPIRVARRNQTGWEWVTLGEILSKEDLAKIEYSRINTKKDSIQRYLRYLCGSNKQRQARKKGAGTNRSTHPTKAGRGRSRLPRAKVGGRMMVSNIPQAIKGRRYQRMMLNQSRLKLNRKEKQNGISSSLYRLLRSGKIILLPQEIMNGKTKALYEYLGPICNPKTISKSKRPVIMGELSGKRALGNLRGIVINQRNKNYYALGTHHNRLIFATIEGLSKNLTSTWA